MFWRFGFHSASAIDGLLDKETTTLEDLMSEDELLQEVKSQNNKLLDFLCKSQNLEKLMTFLIKDDFDDEKKFKYPFIASEIFGCEVFALCDTLLSNKPILSILWTLLDKQPPLNALQASYFTKVNTVLLSKKTAALIQFIREQPDLVKKIITHIGCSAIADFVLKLISVEELPEGQGTVKWLKDEGLIPRLFTLLDPTQDPDVHITASQTLLDIITVSYQSIQPPEPVGGAFNQGMGGFNQGGMQGKPGEPSIIISRDSVGNGLIEEMKSDQLIRQLVDYMLDSNAPHATSCLTNGINIIMELIRRYCSEIEHAEFQHHEYTLQLGAGNPVPMSPTHEKLVALATDLNDLFAVLGSKTSMFKELLDKPRSATTPIETTLGKRIPLSSERLKICELFAEILHLQYLLTSSPLFEQLVMSVQGRPGSNRPMPTIADGLMHMGSQMVKDAVMPTCINLFFTFQWNNFLHSVVYDMIAKIFNTFTYTSGVSGQPGIAGGPPGQEPEQTLDPVAQEKMNSLRASVKTLVISIFKEGKLMENVVNAQRMNDYEVEQPKGTRLGYMGHLTYMADEICKLVEKSGNEFPELEDIFQSAEWEEYVAHPLHETRERDRHPLGGLRPEAPTGFGGFAGGLGQPPTKFGDEADMGKTKKSVTGRGNSSGGEDEDDVGAFAGDSNTFNDQFARYLCQQLVKDMPDRFLGGDMSDDDENENEMPWMSGITSTDVDFDLTAAMGSRLEQLGGDDENSEEVGVDTSNSDEAANDVQFVADFDKAFSSKILSDNDTASESSSNTAVLSLVSAPDVNIMNTPAAKTWANFATFSAPPATSFPGLDSSGNGQGPQSGSTEGQTQSGNRDHQGSDNPQVN